MTLAVSAPAGLAFRTVVSRRVSICLLAGELDRLGVPRFLDHLNSTSPVDTALVVDLRDVSFVDSAGLRALRTVVQSSHGDRLVVLSGPSAHLAGLLDLVGVSQQAVITDDLATAVILVLRHDETWRRREEPDEPRAASPIPVRRAVPDHRARPITRLLPRAGIVCGAGPKDAWAS